MSKEIPEFSLGEWKQFRNPRKWLRKVSFFDIGILHEKIRQIEVNTAKHSGNLCDLTIFLLLKFLTWEFLLFILMIALSELLS